MDRVDHILHLFAAALALSGSVMLAVCAYRYLHEPRSFQTPVYLMTSDGTVLRIEPDSAPPATTQ
jgi:hypothetical protein